MLKFDVIARLSRSIFLCKSSRDRMTPLLDNAFSIFLFLRMHVNLYYEGPETEERKIN